MTHTDPPIFDPKTEQALTEAATVTPEDIERAKLDWHLAAPRDRRAMLDAEEVEP